MKKNIRLIAGAMILLLAANTLISQNSVLSSGDWYKIAVQNTGIHRITYDDLIVYGIDPSQFNPKFIRLYGNGNGMLPEDNDEFRYDDLQENSIFVFGEEDGTFDNGDYILFYGEGPTEWNFNETCGLFEHEVNLYSDFTYYFLNFDLGEGKRIQTQYSTIIPPTYISTSFNDYYYHELELENLIHSGRIWYGERFEDTLEYTYEMEFPNIATSYPVTFIADAAARSWAISNFSFQVNEQEILTLTIPPVNYSNNNSDYAKIKKDTTSFLTDTPTLNLTVTYDNPTGASIGWLDYFIFNARRQNIFNSGQMRFRDLVSVEPGNTTEFQITSSSESFTIWNVTDPLNPRNLDYQYADEIAKYTLETDSLLEFIVFDDSQFFSPDYNGPIENQDLHALEPVDLVIVTHKDFETQAQQLADFRENHDGLSAFVVTPEEIYHEFSSGAQDITAIRDFMKYLYDKSNREKPESLLLFGDASFDYKNINNSNTNYIPVWESPQSINPVNSYCTDDFYSEFDEENKTSMLKIGIGRLPVKSTQESNAIVEKTIHYSSNITTYGSWRNEYLIIADDEDNNIHLNNAEDIATIVDTAGTFFNVSKIYLDAFEQMGSPNGPIYPEVNQAITDKINKGVNIINYIGHGFYNGLAHENILTDEDLDNWENYDNYPLFFSASCSFGQFDDPDKYSLSEKAILMEGRGLSSVISATRATYAGANQAFQEKFFLQTMHHPEYSLGQLLKLAKQETGGFENNRKYCLFGDPSMKMTIPTYKVITEAVNGIPISEPLDTINPGEQIIVSGFITDAAGEPYFNFNGSMEVRVFDRIETDSTLGNDQQSIITGFLVRDSVLLTLNTEIINGQFAFSFNLPYNLSEDYGTIKLSYYAMDYPLDARGEFSNLMVGGPASSIPEKKAITELISFYPTLIHSDLNYITKNEIATLDLEIFDLSGRRIHFYSEQNLPEGTKAAMDISKLNAGMYIMHIRADNSIGSIKLIKK